MRGDGLCIGSPLEPKFPPLRWNTAHASRHYKHNLSPWASVVAKSNGSNSTRVHACSLFVSSFCIPLRGHRHILFRSRAARRRVLAALLLLRQGRGRCSIHLCGRWSLRALHTRRRRGERRGRRARGWARWSAGRGRASTSAARTGCGAALVLVVRHRGREVCIRVVADLFMGCTCEESGHHRRQHTKTMPPGCVRRWNHRPGGSLQTSDGTRSGTASYPPSP